MFYEQVADGRVLACGDCGALVDGSERGRALHTRWHRDREPVIDVTERSAPVGV